LVGRGGPLAHVTEPGRLESMINADLETLDRELAQMTDAEVRSAYLATDGMPGNEVADLIAGECERRGIDLRSIVASMPGSSAC
jgi:hypothetical protein